MKRNKTSQPRVNRELQGLEIEINSFGEIKSSMNIDKLNKFLDDHVEDKKLKNREDKD